ncbi:MAG: T9SS type A sorting domain-containing protein [Candidatus Hatepunaea meridiana]|nr:T9SS type A sorting domain-containing protein [Candidatus Hatepunaea meridiana]
MKSLRIFLICALVVIVSSNAGAQVFFPDNTNGVDGFHEYLALNNFTLANVNGGVDFCFGVNGQGQEQDDIFTILAVWNVIVDPGVEIEFANDVELIVDGQINVGNQGVANMASISGWNGSRWNSIVLRGNGGFGTGVGNFNFTMINGGGDNAGHGGLISLTNHENIGTIPQLRLWNCLLEDSETNGINIYDVVNGEPEADDIRVSSTINLFNNTQITGAGLGAIADNGIHYQQNVDEDVTSHLEIRASKIDNCTDCGIIHDLCMAEDGQNIGFTLIIRDLSGINLNGDDGVRINCPVVGELFESVTTMEIDLDQSEFNSNGTDEGARGWGFILNELPGQFVSFINITDCKFTNNDNGGLCIFHAGASPIFIDGCIMANNAANIPEDAGQHPNVYLNGQGALIYARSPGCGQLVATVSNCTIKDNGLTGLHLRLWRGHNGMTEWFIQGNYIHDNGTAVNWDADANDLMEGANLHLYTNVDNAVITNNILEGSYSGIYLEHHFNPFEPEFEDPDHMPRGLSIYNNIQYGEVFGENQTRHGLVIEYLDDANGLDDDAIYNNSFTDNLVSGAELGNDPAFPFGNLLEDELCNNFFGFNNNGRGVNYVQGGGPNYLHNGFWQNNQNWFGCGQQNPQQGDPLFVNAGAHDYHISWNSPHVNWGWGGVGNPPSDPHNRMTHDRFLEMDIHGANIHRDGSNNNIGPYGGFFSNGTVGYELTEGTDYSAEGEAEDLGWDPYCVIDGVEDVPIDQNLTEYYRAYQDYEIPQNDPCTFERGVFIYNEENVRLDVFAPLTVDGQVGVNINGLQDPVNPRVCLVGNDLNDIWRGSIFWQTAGWQTDLNYMIVSEAEVGLNFVGIPNGANRINVENCYITNCTQLGIRIHDTQVNIHGEEPEPNPVEFRNLVSNVVTPGDAHDERGIDVQFSAFEEVLITNTSIRNCGNPDEDRWLNSGLVLFDADPMVRDVTITGCGVTGSAVVFSTPDLDPPADDANDIFNNGLELDQELDNGAELWVGWWSPSFTFDENDIWDEDGNDNPRGLLIFDNDAVGNHQITPNWWGDANANGRFFSTGANNFNWVPPSQNENDIDNLESFRYGKRLFYAGRYREAIRAFCGVIADDPRSAQAAASISYLLGCYNSLDNGFRELRDYYDRLIEEFEDHPFGYVVRLAKPRCAIQERRYEDAMDEYSELVENGRNQRERALSDICYQKLELLVDANWLNSADYSKRQIEIDKLLYAFGSSDEDQHPIPTKFDIISVHPNPFNSTTRISYSLDSDANITLSLFDLSGREVARLVNNPMTSGKHSISWDASDLSSGIYMCRLSAGSKVKTTKLALVK